MNKLSRWTVCGKQISLCYMRGQIKIQTKCRDRDTEEEVSPGASTIQYESIEVLLGDDEFGQVNPNNTSKEGFSHIKGNNTSSFEGTVVENDDGKQDENYLKVDDCLANTESPSKNLPSEVGLLTGLRSSPSSDPLKLKSGSQKKVAFIFVNKPAMSTSNDTGLHLKGTDQIQSQSDNNKDPFFSLLTAGNVKDNLF